MNALDILSRLSDSGFRLTPVRKLVVEYVAGTATPVTAEDFIVFLEDKGLSPNRTTVYRELDFLQAQDVIQELDFGEGKKRYELASHAHHHHLICTNCTVIEEVQVRESGLEKQEEQFLKANGFKVTRHMLEFFGLCKNCQRSK